MSREKILIVEDSAIQREMLVRLLSHEGYEVEGVADGAAGIERIRSFMPSLVISDISMPVMNGYELCTIIKQDGALAHIPVMLLTQLSDIKDIICALNAGADNYITKPFDEELLFRKVESLLSKDKNIYKDPATGDLSLNFEGETYKIDSGRRRILDLLLSTYENTIEQNHKLAATQLKLKATNEQLQREIAEQKRMANELRNHRDLLEDIVTARTDELRKHKDLLEEMVETRTHELITANDQLHSEIEKHQLTELELQKSRQEAIVASNAKSEFLANMSHEIRTPMNAIIGMAELVLNSSLNAEQRELIEIVLHSGESLLVLLNSILDFSKIEAGKMVLDAVGFNLVETMEKTLDTLAVTADRKGLELVCDIGDNVPGFVIGDPDRLRQVIINLTGNAIKFTNNGEVIVRVEYLGEDAHDSGIKAARLKFSVIDTGIGIPANKISTIFDSFSQLDGSMTRRFGGTGLGLSISSRLVSLMGGTINVSSKIGKGSTFYFEISLPLPERISPNYREIDLSKLRILILDDSKSCSMTLKRILTRFGSDVTEAADGATGLAEINRARAQKRPFDIIFIDNRMPGIAGRDLARSIMTGLNHTEKLLMLLGSTFRRGDMEMIHELGLYGYLQKPVRVNQLVMLLSNITEIPVIKEATDEAICQDDKAPSMHKFPNLKILIVEDNPTNVKTVSKMLEYRQYSTEVVENGYEALKILAKTKFDLILMDIHMPVMDGLKATEIIRHTHDLVTDNDIPIIALTAHALKGDRERFLEIGMNDYIAKPYRMDDLFAVIDRVMANRFITEFDGDEADFSIRFIDSDSKAGRDITDIVSVEIDRHLGLIESAIAEKNMALVEHYAASLREFFKPPCYADLDEETLRLVLSARKGDTDKVGTIFARLMEKSKGLI